MPKNLTALKLWANMNKKVSKIMKNYQDDFFVYDKKMFTNAYNRNQMSFIWFVYQSGTHFIEFDHPAVEEHFSAIRNVKGYYTKNGTGELYLASFDDASLKKIDWHEAEILLNIREAVTA